MKKRDEGEGSETGMEDAEEKSVRDVKVGADTPSRREHLASLRS